MRAFFCLLIAALACATDFSGCSPARRSGSDQRGAAAEAAVIGTCIDAESGERLAGVKVEGPHGASAVSSRDGRFEMRGLRAGDGGNLVASLSDGRSASLTLRPLSAGDMEVVLQLGRPR
jgi:hypothetical protein